MTTWLSERQAARVGFGKKRTRKKAKMPEGDFEAVKAFVRATSCWHGYELKHGRCFCKLGLCKEER